MKPKYVLASAAILLLIVFVSGFYLMGGKEYFSPVHLKILVTQWGSLAPIIYISLYALSSLLFVPATPLTLLGGALFGPLFGVIYTLIGATAGASVSFLVSRFIGQTFRTDTVGRVAKKLARYDEKIQKNGFMTVFTLRLIPVFPFNGLNFGLGLTSVSFPAYFLATLLGIIPGTVAFVYFGDSLASLKFINIVIALVIIIAIAALGNYAARVYSKSK